MKKSMCVIKDFWRYMNGDSAYERYLAHWSQQHAKHGKPPQSRKDFFAAEMQRKWHGIRRCC